MGNGEKVIIRNGLKKNFIVYKDIQPEFSAIHTKLCADGMELPQELMYLLGNGYARELMYDDLVLFNDTFLNDLSGCLGIYLEDYEENDEPTFFEDVKKNAAINIAPPMIFVKYQKKEYLSIVCKVYDDHTYDVISPVSKEVIRITKEQVVYDKPWYMMNSPRFMSPVFRNKEQLILEALYRMSQRYHLSKSEKMKKLYTNDTNKVVERMVQELSREDLMLRKMFCQGMRYAPEVFGLRKWLDCYEKKLEECSLKYLNLEDCVKKHMLVEELVFVEDQILTKVSEFFKERKCLA